MKVVSEALLIMDLHAHVSMAEVIGLLGGRYSEAEKTLEVSLNVSHSSVTKSCCHTKYFIEFRKYNWFLSGHVRVCKYRKLSIQSDLAFHLLNICFLSRGRGSCRPWLPTTFPSETLQLLRAVMYSNACG